jgi:NADH-quinone oxidoreductase subunit E
VSEPRRRGDALPTSGISDAALRAELEGIVSEYPERRAGALMCLHRVQRHRGRISLADQILVSEVLGISPAHVRELMTFYTLFAEADPAQFHLQLCRTLPCMLRGARGLKDRIRQRLGIGAGETTADGCFRLTEVECLASCDTAPVVQINEDYFEGLTPEGLEALLDELAARRVPRAAARD